MKNKLDYLSELEGELKFLKKKDRIDLLKYYQQKIDTELDYGTPEEKIIKNLPSPREVAIKVYNDKGIDYIKLQKGRIKVSTIIFTILSGLLMIGTVYIGANIIITLVKMLVNMFTLYSPFFKLPAIDLLLSTLFLTIYIFLVIIFIVILIEVMLLIIRTLINKLFDIYPSIKPINLEPYSIFYWMNKLWKNEQVIYKTFGVLVVLLIGVGIAGYVTKSYVYRVITNTTSQEDTYQLKEIDLNKISIKVVNLETGLVIVPTDEDFISIKYKYEIDHKITWKFENDTLVITTQDPKNYDLFNLLKEPLQYIYIMVPSTVSLDNIELKMTYGELKLEQIEISSLDILMLNGQILLRNIDANQVQIDINKINLKSEGNSIDNLTMKVQLGSYTWEKDNINQVNVDNIFAKGIFKDFQADEITINNRSGNFDMVNLEANQLTVNAVGGDLYIHEYQFNDFKYKGSNIGNISLSKGSHIKATIELPKGTIDFLQTRGDTYIEGYDLLTTSADQISGRLEIIQELGKINILNELNSTNKIDYLKCVSSDVDVIIKTTYIKEMDLDLGKAIVSIEDVYGKVVNIKVKSGDLNYLNSNLNHQFDFFQANIDLGSKKVNIPNTVE